MLSHLGWPFHYYSVARKTIFIIFISMRYIERKKEKRRYARRMCSMKNAPGNSICSIGNQYPDPNIDYAVLDMCFSSERRKTSKTRQFRAEPSALGRFFAERSRRWKWHGGPLILSDFSTSKPSDVDALGTFLARFLSILQTFFANIWYLDEQMRKQRGETRGIGFTFRRRSGLWKQRRRRIVFSMKILISYRPYVRARARIRTKIYAVRYTRSRICVAFHESWRQERLC